jgi:hypothetical protein
LEISDSWIAFTVMFAGWIALAEFRRYEKKKKAKAAAAISTGAS